MFSFFRPQSDRGFIDRGWVPCPLRGGDVELDVCTGCRWLREIDLKSKLPSVRCRPEIVRSFPVVQ